MYSDTISILFRRIPNEIYILEDSDFLIESIGFKLIVQTGMNKRKKYEHVFSRLFSCIFTNINIVFLIERIL